MRCTAKTTSNASAACGPIRPHAEVCLRFLLWNTTFTLAPLAVASDTWMSPREGSQLSGHTLACLCLVRYRWQLLLW